MARKTIPHINVPIQTSNGSMELAWYLFLQWVAENAGKVDLSDYFTKEETETLLAAKADIDDLATVAFTGDYDDLSDKPTIGDGTITVKQGGVTKGTFTVNQSGNTELNLDKGGDIDNLTITENADDEMQAIGVINKNTETGATNPIYDWVGTEAEYEAQNIATLHPEWLCFITDDCENINPFRREVAERNMGELVYSTIPVTDAGLHLADGELLDGTGIYADFYDYMVGVYNAGHTSIFCSEADWQAEITDHNMCGKYVLDTTNHTIRLPSIWGWVEGIRTESQAGTYVPPGLPNITAGGIMGWQSDSAEFTNGAYHKYYNNNNYSLTSNSSFIKTGPGDFDASRSSAVYGRSSEVTPRGVQVLIYIVIANTVKTPVQVDIDNIATQMNLVTSRINEMYPHRLIAYQEPTNTNNYTWYRKYADGWVEQGGVWTGTLTATNGNDATSTQNLPIAMADTNYCVTITNNGGTTSPTVWEMWCVQALTTASFVIHMGSYANTRTISRLTWEARGRFAS